MILVDLVMTMNICFLKPKGSSKTITTKRSEKVDGAHYLAHEKEASDPKVQKKIKNKYNEL